MARRTAKALIGLAALLAVSCTKKVDGPPRDETPLVIPEQVSTLTLPVSVPLDRLEQVLAERTPRKLWSINEQHKDCIPAQRVEIFGKKHKVTPDISCRIVGQVTRGRITVTGSGSRLMIHLPVDAEVAARDVGGILKGKSARGSAIVELELRLTVRPEWRPAADVEISYDWSDPPTMKIVGQEVKLTSRADKELAKVIQNLEQELEREVAKIDLRPKLERAWKNGFTVVSVERDDPPTWLKIEPQRVGIGTFHVVGRDLVLPAFLEAKTGIFLGGKPELPEPGPLPPMTLDFDDPGLSFTVPVLANYGLLEPIILKALKKLEAKKIEPESVGPVDVTFSRVQMYGVKGGRVAIGVDLAVMPQEGAAARLVGPVKGTVWLTGVPANAANSRVVGVKDLHIAATSDSKAANILTEIMLTEEVQKQIEGSLQENFEKDYQRVMGIVERKVRSLRKGDWVISFTVESIDHGTIKATGSGLYLPVKLTGTGKIFRSPA